ncbi:PREDICTED: cytochrome P450 4F4-like [Branchiostoma belcheri]|uniref:Cytochrome P450 4F4-like n=1 Tax=Branchiostoma belcheri TaxID=7741 RepID=A0A6P4YUG4_BRABE|nr:PREDICTED: cytochrome P450 4F4-like [Branchiostoma belcheri]
MATWAWVFLPVALLVSVKLVKFVISQISQRRTTRQFVSPPSHWLYGHLKQLLPDESGWPVLKQMMSDFSNYVLQLWVGPFLPLYILIHPDTCRSILSTHEPKDELFYGFLKPMIGDGLLLSHGSKWHRNRRLLTPAFHFEILKPYVTLFSESTNVLIDKWTSLGPGCTVEMFDHLSLMTLDSILKCSLSYHSNCQTANEPSPYIRAVYDISRLFVERVRFVPFHSDIIYSLSPSGRRFYKACDVVHNFSENVIRERKAQLAEAKESDLPRRRKGKCLDFLDILLEARDEDGTGLTDAEIRDEVDTFLFEGHDTTASGISWTLYHLAKHLQYQDRCRREVGALLHGRTTMTWEDMSQLPFTTMCIKESLRLRPPVPGVSRTLTQNLVLPDGRKISPGFQAFAGIMATHQNPLVWEDPEVFDPLRFSPENSRDRHSHAFIPFSAGPRNCIGQHFAMIEMKVAVALILQNFRLELNGPPPFYEERIVLRARNGIWLKLHKME